MVVYDKEGRPTADWSKISDSVTNSYSGNEREADYEQK